MPYAETTSVSVERTRLEIERLLADHGASRFAYLGEDARAVLVFEMKDRRLKFDLPLPRLDQVQSRRLSSEGRRNRLAQLRRSRWRALFLVIKAKLEAVDSGIETFEESFLAHVVMPDGSTVGDLALPAIASAYKEGRMVPLLPAPRVG